MNITIFGFTFTYDGHSWLDQEFYAAAVKAVNSVAFLFLADILGNQLIHHLLIPDNLLRTTGMLIADSFGPASAYPMFAHAAFFAAGAVPVGIVYTLVFACIKAYRHRDGSNMLVEA